MIRRTLLASVLTLSSAVAFTPAAGAVTTDIPFTGTVLSVCAFVPTAGLLGTTDNSTALDSTATGGLAGIAVLTCNTRTNLTVDAPIQTLGPSFTPTAASATVSGNGLVNNVLSNLTGPAAPVALPIGVTTLNVNMRVVKDDFLEAGAYGYKVKLTATPQ
ncbi:hypothetical protein [Leptolyngbya sp. FACHB-261]|uniref:hypothetical protein n=1 Tax=Leptolyngbya sp. FACHB-261 TaxID=2692806 RepID=UPI0016867EED|nr:hypothetical protein [Leptolyngbya sp. FACHB-261]MBD2100865.1 hypothetical protein [Leptolyngbya sp. FACHB-261]